MKRKVLDVIGSVLIGGGIVSAAVVICAEIAGCGPNTGFVTAVDQYTNVTVTPEWLHYVDNDSTLSPEQKERRHRLAEAMAAMVMEYKK